MVKANKKSISRTKSSVVNRSKLILLIKIAILCLVIVIGALFVLIQRTNHSAAIPSTTSRVNTLAVAYDVSSGRAVKRTDPLTKSIRNFLEANADASGCPAAQPDYITIVAATTDGEQLLYWV